MSFRSSTATGPAWRGRLQHHCSACRPATGATELQRALRDFGAQISTGERKENAMDLYDSYVGALDSGDQTDVLSFVEN